MFLIARWKGHLNSFWLSRMFLGPPPIGTHGLSISVASPLGQDHCRVIRKSHQERSSDWSLISGFTGLLDLTQWAKTKLLIGLSAGHSVGESRGLWLECHKWQAENTMNHTIETMYESKGALDVDTKTLILRTRKWELIKAIDFPCDLLSKYIMFRLKSHINYYLRHVLCRFLFMPYQTADNWIGYILNKIWLKQGWGCRSVGKICLAYMKSWVWSSELKNQM